VEPAILASILERHRSGELDLAGALAELRDFPVADLGFAKLDSHRRLRQGYPEVVYCEGKSDAQFRAIVESLLGSGAALLATRVSPGHFEAVRDLAAGLAYDQVSRTLSTRRPGEPDPESPYIAVVTAGTSDIPVAEEAAITAEVFGNRVERVYDVGVAGIHRLFARLETIRGARVVVAIAGMEGALVSVIGGLVGVPVLAVPTSVGYGASFGGLAALLAMLNSCAAGVSVVNIDNGFGAGYLASMINKG
jgi:pyridinium-3,5-biscarboxylic acid mononucleotide synthase